MVHRSRRGAHAATSPGPDRPHRCPVERRLFPPPPLHAPPRRLLLRAGLRAVLRRRPRVSRPLIVSTAQARDLPVPRLCSLIPNAIPRCATHGSRLSRRIAERATTRLFCMQLSSFVYRFLTSQVYRYTTSPVHFERRATPGAGAAVTKHDSHVLSLLPQLPQHQHPGITPARCGTSNRAVAGPGVSLP